MTTNDQSHPQTRIDVQLGSNVSLCRSNWIAICLWLLTIQGLVAEDWPQWRGPRGDGTSTEKNLPTQWSPDKNVRWKIALPEPGNSTPVVWGNRVFLTQASAKDKQRQLLCFDCEQGNLLWKTGLEWQEAEPTHSTNPFCSASPVTDGQRVVAWFGSAGVICCDMDGKELWRRDLGIQKHIWGYGASPVILGNRVFLSFGPGPRSFLIALDIQTGKTLWQHDEPMRTEGTTEAKFSNPDYYGSWSTPVIRSLGDHSEIIMSFPFRLCALDVETGSERWTSQGINALVYTTPLVSQDLVIAMGGYNGMAMAIRTNGTMLGDITSQSRLWRHEKTKQRIGSGVIHEGHVYIHNDPGIAECFELATGKLVWEQRLSGAGKKGTNWSSLVLADGLCYSITQGGDCFVFRASPTFELISTNSLGETSNSSIVPSNGCLYIRTHQHLWCIANR